MTENVFTPNEELSIQVERASEGLFKVHIGHVLDQLAKLPDASIHAVLTSPPYYGLRSYDVAAVEWPDGWIGHLGLEPTPDLYVQHLVDVFTQVRRVLRDDGSVWVNLGDTYFGDSPPRNRSQDAFSKEWNPADTASRGGARRSAAAQGDLKPKMLIGVPWMFAFAMRQAGWYLRSENIWHKRGGMPESVFDRPGREHEHVFQFTKRPSYFYDADAVRVKYDGPVNRWGGNEVTAEQQEGSPRGLDRDRSLRPNESGRLLRSVWSVPTANYPGAHFAVMPVELAELVIKAATSQKGCCPTCGSPYRRVVEAEGESNEQRIARQPQRVRKRIEAVDHQAPRHDGGLMQIGLQVAPPGRARRTVGWERDCSCEFEMEEPSGEWHTYEPDPVPAVVLDPFVGSGTTMVVARRLGRASVGVELSGRYAREELAGRLAMWWRDAWGSEEKLPGQLEFEIG